MKTLFFLLLLSATSALAQDVVSLKAVRTLPISVGAPDILLVSNSQNIACKMKITPAGFPRAIEKDNIFTVHSFSVVKEGYPSFEDLATDAYERFEMIIPVDVTTITQLQEYAKKQYGVEIHRVIRAESRFSLQSAKGLIYSASCVGARHGFPDLVIALANSGNFKYLSDL